MGVGPALAGAVVPIHDLVDAVLAADHQICTFDMVDSFPHKVEYRLLSEAVPVIEKSSCLPSI